MGERQGAPAVRRDLVGGGVTVTGAAYALDVAGDGCTARLGGPAGDQVAVLHLAAALDCREGPDETAEVAPPVVDEGGDWPVIEVERVSTRWQRAGVRITCRPDVLELRWWVEGDGALTEARLLSGRSVMAGAGSGTQVSGTCFHTLFTPNPGDPNRLVRSTRESAVLGVVGDARPGRGHWFFSPAPYCLALTTARDVPDPARPLPETWWTLAVGAPVAELTFTQLEYVPADGGFGLRLDYEGHTRVEGTFTSPTVLITPALPDPYEGLRRHRAQCLERGWAHRPETRDRPAWWSEPMFCGWGAQNHRAAVAGGRAADRATQEEYDGFLAHLSRHDLWPGTVVVDDKWQARYGTCEPDTAKWPDLKGWIAERRREGRRVLLWWPAWEWEGLPEQWCVRNPQGRPVALDPSHPEARRALADAVTRMLGPQGLDADGLKIDFTARTPSGATLTHHGPQWGAALLHRMLETVHRAAKAAKPDALIITHTPHPAFADVTDMVRLNDMLRLDDPEPGTDVVPQMLHRAAVVRASCPDLLVDTDDWCAPDLPTWRAYLAAKPGLGVPALYYTSHVDRTGEAFEPADYRALAAAWQRWRESARKGVAEPC